MLSQMVKGDSEKRLFCLIQAEKFICINGFKQSTVSPKRRALHHCYAYMRIMAETTSIADDLSANIERTSISDEDPAYTDFRKCPNIAFSDNIMETEKDPRVAQRDLNLAIPGRWSLTLFPKMYGVAESFLMLMSQVIRLANERDRSLENGDDGMLNLKDFWVRAKTLERGIQHLRESCTSMDSSAHDNEGSSQVGDGRALAMYTALMIFFYRRIYDLDAALLQQEVDSVRDSLVRVRQDEAGYSEGNTATLIWPAFIAACEAVSLESQHFFWSWFDSCLTTTGLVNASLAKQILETIWTKRREAGQYEKRCNWPDVLRAKRIRLMLM
jgi:arginine metabolism regulation protein II